MAVAACLRSGVLALWDKPLRTKLRHANPTERERERERRVVSSARLSIFEASRFELLTIDPLLLVAPLQPNRMARQQRPTGFLKLPLELRLEIYSYLFPDIYSYSSGIFEPHEIPQISLRKDLRRAHPAVLRTCKQIYHEAIPSLYHNRCLNSDIAGHLLRSVANRHDRISSTHFRAWLGLSSYFKEGRPIDDVDNLDWTRLEDICVTFWPVHGCPIKLRDAQRVTAALCKQLQKAARLSKVDVVFRDSWPALQSTATKVTCRQMTDVEYLLQPFMVLRGVKEVRIEMPIYRSHRLPCAQLATLVEDDQTLKGQIRFVEGAKALMTRRADCYSMEHDLHDNT
ncbi:MAG: hypothetical protein Q9218_004990 [Villophora microphyllina]